MKLRPFLGKLLFLIPLAVLPWACSRSINVPPTSPSPLANTPTATFTNIFSPTPVSGSPTFTLTPTATDTFTITYTTDPGTPTNTSTITLTPTITLSPSPTATIFGGYTSTPTFTSTVAMTSTMTFTATPTCTATFTKTPPFTPAGTWFTPTSTITNTPTLSLTPTLTGTPNITATACVGGLVMGNNTVGYSYLGSTEYVYVNLFTPSITTTLVSLTANMQAGSYYNLVIYADNGSGTSPTTLLAQTGPQTAISAGWITSTLSPSLAVSPSSNYWMGVAFNSTPAGIGYWGGACCVPIEEMYAPGSPADHPPTSYSGFLSSGWKMSAYANGCPFPTPTPTPTITATPTGTWYTPTPTNTPTTTFTPTPTPT